MKILFVNRWYPPHTGYGGVATYNFNMARAISGLGHTVSVLAGRWSGEVPALEQDNGVKVYRLLSLQHPHLARVPFLGWYMRSITDFFYSMKVAKFIWQLSGTDRPDVVEFADVNAEGFASLAFDLLPRTVVRCHLPVFILRNYYQSMEQPYDTELTARMERYSLSKAIVLTAPSKATACQVTRIARLSQPVIDIPNPLDTRAFAPLAKNLDDPSPEANKFIRVLFVGRFDRVKGVGVLAEAIPLVLQQDRNIRFDLIGDDRPDGLGSTWVERLGNSFVSAGVQDHVRFPGAKRPAELPDWYDQSDLVLVPSIVPESFSYTCAQAMACGKPVIVSDIGGLPETLGEGCGLLVPPGDPLALANAILNLAHDPALRIAMGQAGRQRALAHFSTSTVAAKMLEIYGSIL